MTNSPKRAEEPTVPSQQDLPADTAGAVAREVSGRNTAVLVGFTALSNLADGVMKIALPLVATSLIQVSGVSMFSTLMMSAITVTLDVAPNWNRFSNRISMKFCDGIRSEPSRGCRNTVCVPCGRFPALNRRV